MLFPKHTRKTIALTTAISKFESGRIVVFDGLYTMMQGRGSEEAIKFLQVTFKSNMNTNIRKLSDENIAISLIYVS
jgi:hypothetical protein